MSTYSKGLRHGYEDMSRAVQAVLDLDIPDAEKLERIGWAVAPRIASAVTEAPAAPVTEG